MKVTLIRGRAIDAAVYKVAKTLSQNGYRVQLLVWDRQNTLKGKSAGGYMICRFDLRAPHDRFTALFYVPIWWVYQFLFLLRDNSDVIHACDLDTLIPVILAKVVKRFKLCYTIYDFYANNLHDGPPRLIRKAIRTVVASVERFGIRFAQALFLVDESRYEEVKGARIHELVYMYNSPPDYFDSNKTKETRGISSEITIFYAGIITRMRGLQHIIKAVQEVEGVILILAGSITDKDLVTGYISTSRRIQYLGWLPSYEDVIEKTLQADILFRFSDPTHPKTKYESPNKLFEAMMCGKPIIVSDGGAMANIVREENCGLVVPYGDIDALREVIVKLKNDVNLRQRLGNNGRKAYEQKYSWSAMEKRLLDAYAGL
jgi:glycosyltransferase involved in cell wall biosynthesis